MTNPPRLVLDLSPCILGTQKPFTVKDPSIAGVRFSQFKPKTTRIVFDFSQTPVYQISHKKGNALSNYCRLSQSQTPNNFTTPPKDQR